MQKITVESLHRKSCRNGEEIYRKPLELMVKTRLFNVDFPFNQPRESPKFHRNLPGLGAPLLDLHGTVVWQWTGES